MVFPKKLHWNMSFLVSSVKMIFLFAENNILFFKRKYDIFFKCSEKMAFPKMSHWNMIFLLSSGKIVFLFPENMIFFLQTENKR